MKETGGLTVAVRISGMEVGPLTDVSTGGGGEKLTILAYYNPLIIVHRLTIIKMKILVNEIKMPCTIMISE